MAVEDAPKTAVRTYRIQYIATDAQPEGWTVFVEAFPVIVVDSPREALALALEMAERDCRASGRDTVVVVQPGGCRDPIRVQDFSAS